MNILNRRSRIFLFFVLVLLESPSLEWKQYICKAALQLKEKLVEFTEMIRKPSDSQAIGFHLDGEKLKVAHVISTSGPPKLKRLEEILLKTGEEGTLIYENTSDQALVLEFGEKFLTVADFFFPDLITRRVRIRLQKEKEIEAAFPFEAESALPYPIDQAVFDKISLGKDPDGALFTLVATKKKSIEDSLKSLEKLKIDPEILLPTPCSLAAFAAHYVESKKKVLLLHVATDSISTSIIEEGKLLSSHRAPLGIVQLQNGYEADQARDPELLETPFFQLDFQGEDLALSPLLQQAIAKLRKEIEWLVVAELRPLEENREEQPVFLLTGEILSLKGIFPLLFSQIDLQEASLIGKEGLEENLLHCRINAAAIGSALSALDKYPNLINFRQNEFAFSQPWKRFRKSIALFLGLSLLMAFMIFLFGEALIGLKEDELRTQYAETLAEAQISYPEFEAEIVGSQETPLLKSLSFSELQKRIVSLDKKLSARPDYFALDPGIPRVSDFLAWLNSLPLLQKEDAAIQVESLTYTLVKRPEMNKKQEHYQVKIDLEISAKAPKIAREFHNLLIEPNEIVDQKGEVKWGQSKGNWRTSFYLKDKTVYPTTKGAAKQ